MTVAQLIEELQRLGPDAQEMPIWVQDEGAGEITEIVRWAHRVCVYA